VYEWLHTESPAEKLSEERKTETMRTAEHSLDTNGLANPTDYKVKVVYIYDRIPGNKVKV
jgi:hypothetical protein